MVLKTDRLPDIVQDFLRHADTLWKLVGKATWEVVEDIKAMLYDTESTQYHARLEELRNDDACRFLLKHPAFIDWYGASDSQWLAVLGDMGSGKTVSMAFLVDELSRRNECQIPPPKTCYYYCRDAQSGQAGPMFSTLILALLEQLPGLKKTFYEWHRQNQASGVLQPQTNTSKLGQFLETLLQTLDRPIFVVIDGLDECDRGSRKALLKLLTTLSQKTPRLKILLSSQPEEEISKQLRAVAGIYLSSDLHRDTLIVRHTVETRLDHLSEDVRELLIKAVPPFSQAKRRGADATFLGGISLVGAAFEALSPMIARQSSDVFENKELVATALMLLAAARRPLSVQELAWAVALATAQHQVTTVNAPAQLVDHERRQVRLVHQSVKDFITRDWARLPEPTTSTGLDRMNESQQFETPKAFTLDVCMNYLLLDEIGSFHLFSEQQVAINELPQEFDLFEDTDLSEYDPYCTWEVWGENMIRYDPNERGFGQFFVYAASHWTEHFGGVQGGNLERLAKVERLCEASSTRLDNWINQNCRPGCAILSRFGFDSRLYDPPSITSLYGSKALLCDMLQHSDFDAERFLPTPAFNAADQLLQWGDLSGLRILFLEDKFSHRLRNLGFFSLIIRQWSVNRERHDDWDVAFGLVDYMLDTIVRDRWGSELFCIAARAGCMPLVQHLLHRAQHKTELRTELLRDPQSIAQAVSANHIEVVEYLLGQEGLEAHVKYVNARGENLLHLASKTRNPAMLCLLVPHVQESGRTSIIILR
ncbi:hypothetical protein G647_10274 [Cladophialophora carrionii CBS 160.54]|uniref:NACHT domain-containing protein n=1 Tax=Cladophialophora carrionii CBS 160.54 TaxID=1279043 RepID=V9DKH7_9EURO|nr:uncharacterized protein G647_10274 [Cladophialophora carrionii CBS 160.54]ETI26828.1 hypothetical protein G647_10274 [Cladophialophora carrionii CBS 160.54]